MSAPLRVGVLGCGVISDAYLTRAQPFEAIRMVACADMDAARAAAKAEKYGIRADTPDALIAADDIDLVINLTPPLAHVATSVAILEAGKHLYTEKPIGVTLEEARRIVAAAETAGRRVGSAPDTFLGGGHQLARRMFDEGAIGDAIAGTIWFASRGAESWHPDPRFFYDRGGGPVLDIGAYYVTALVNLIGPVKRVTAIAGRGFPERLVTSEGPLTNQKIPVSVNTHLAGSLQFANGAIVAIVKSWDLYAEAHYRLELYGTLGTMLLPDPNFFGGDTRIAKGSTVFEAVSADAEPYAAPNRHTTRGTHVADYRIIGVVDMAEAILKGRPHRCAGELALHVLEVLTSLEQAAAEGRHVEIASSCERPAPMTGPF